MNEEDLKLYLATAWSFVQSNSWLAVSALFAWGLVRVLKSDTKIPIDIPPRARPVAAIVFGVIASTLEKIAAGGDWKLLFQHAFIISLMTIFVHVFGVDVLRKGEDIPVPNFLKKKDDNE